MPRSPRIPHLEYRKSGYVWRRRLPRSLTAKTTPSEPLSTGSDSEPILFRTQRQKTQKWFKHSTKLRKTPTFEPFSRDSNQAVLLSLKTHAYPAAQELACRLSALSTLTFQYAASDMTIRTTQVTELLGKIGRYVVQQDELVRALQDKRTPEAAEFAIHQERAIQQTLRQALLLHDRDVMRKPLQDIAHRLGVDLPDGNEDWKLLAYEATRLFINLSEERERREQGLFSAPSPYFTQALSPQPVDPKSYCLGTTSPGDTMIAQGRSTARDPRMDLSPSTLMTGGVSAFSAPAPRQTAQEPEKSIESEVVVKETPPPPAPEPEKPADKEKGDPLAVAVKRVLLKNCKPETIASLKKGADIRIDEAFDAYFDLKSQGYGEEWEKLQKPNPDAGKRWIGSTLPGMRTGKKIWADLQGNKPFRKVREDDVIDCITVIQSIPKLHGKSKALSPTRGYRDLVERIPFIEQKQMNDAELALKRKGETDESAIEAARLKDAIPPLRAETFFKHVRAINRVAKMLIGLGVIQENPFSSCTFTNAEEKSYKAGEAKMARQSWDDRAEDLFATPVFHGETRDEGDPLFWSPLLGFLQGLRSEEGLQLGPDDFGKKNGVDYMRIHNGVGNSVKSEAGERILPIHPALIELGLLDLVELRCKQGKRRLFSNLRRGQTKKTYTEIFTKEFTRYRQAHKVYWHGLDLHATRTTFHHDLMDLSTPGYIRRKLMGHEPLDEGERSYAQNGISLATLHEHVSRIRFNAAAIQSPIRKGVKSGTQKRALELGLRAI